MNKFALAPCPQCARHLRIDEATCPFCRMALPASFREQKPLLPPRQRLGRAALHALRIGAIPLAATACTSDGAAAADSGNVPPADAAQQGPEAAAPAPDAAQFDSMVLAPLYGNFPARPLDAAAESEPDSAVLAPLYGGFPRRLDGAAEAAGGATPDASSSAADAGSTAPTDASTGTLDAADDAWRIVPTPLYGGFRAP